MITNQLNMPAGSIARALYHKLQTQSCAPEDGRNYRPKHVELIVIINKICYCCIQLAVYIIVSKMHGHTNIKSKFHCCLLATFDLYGMYCVLSYSVCHRALSTIQYFHSIPTVT